MLKTVLDFEIFEDFTINQPRQVPIGSVEENEEWGTFWKYLKSGTDLTIINNSNKSSIFLNSLTTGRNNTKINFIGQFEKPKENVFPINTSHRTVYFIDENDDQEKSFYRKKNGLLFGFKNDYKKVWKDLALLNKRKVLAVRDINSPQFSDWEQLKKYITPFTDIIIVDNYIFDERKMESNLFKIIKTYSQFCPTSFNLLIVSFEGTEPYKVQINISEKIEKFIIDERLKCNLSIALATKYIKQHDRNIFTNYLRIKSGDSFNYFDSNGCFITKGTEIDFYSMAEADKYTASEITLKAILDIINKLKNRPNKEKYLYGDLKCNLFH